MHRKTSEPSFIDVLVPDHIGRNDQLDRIDQMIDWPKAYESKERRKRLRERGINDRIMHRSHKNQEELPYWQRKRNALVSKVRAPVAAGEGSGSRVVALMTRRRQFYWGGG